MKIDNTYLYRVPNIQQTHPVKPIRTIPDSTKPVEKVKLDSAAAVKKTAIPAKTPLNLKSVLSIKEQKQLDELFALSAPTAKADVSGEVTKPVRAYAVQQTTSEETAKSAEKFLGTYIDIRG